MLKKQSEQPRTERRACAACTSLLAAVIIKELQLGVRGRVELVGWKMCRPSATLHLGITARGKRMKS